MCVRKTKGTSTGDTPIRSRYARDSGDGSTSMPRPLIHTMKLVKSPLGSNPWLVPSGVTLSRELDCFAEQLRDRADSASRRADLELFPGFLAVRLDDAHVERAPARHHPHFGRRKRDECLFPVQRDEVNVVVDAEQRAAGLRAAPGRIALV